MKIKVAKIIRPLDLGEKAAEYSGQTIHVWINPTLAFMKERDAFFMEFASRQKLLKDAEQKKLENLADLNTEFAQWLDGEFMDKNNEWFARLWSQDDQTATHWTSSEVSELKQVDPALLEWMKSRSIDMIVEYRKAEKKS